VNYAAAVRFLYSLGNEVQTAKFDLERITRILDALGRPDRTCRWVHVAGTNGKGSTCAMIEAGLRAAGNRTGLYTSPHLVEPTERIQIAGAAITQGQFAEIFEEVHETAERMVEEGALDLHPTYFETVTAMAFLLFARSDLDIGVLEVGLGGRLDATNVVSPALSVITPIDFDHQEFLGRTLEQIAAEKAGILKPGIPAVFAEQPQAAEMVLRAHAKGPYTLSRDWAISDLLLEARGSRFRLRGREIVCPLAGEHQVENARTAAIALDELGVSADGIRTARWPGRLERVSERPEVILDGAHNIGGTHALQAYIQRFYSGRRIWMIYGVMRDKDARAMTALLFPLAQRVIITAPANSRAMPPENIPAPEGAVVTHSVAEALEIAGQAEPTDVVFVTGSLFVVGEARARLVQ
jgi:dihydrofolate synthase / folylpolyglutamate synthase